MIEYIIPLAFVLGNLSGWFLRQYTLFRGVEKQPPPVAPYEVRLTKPTSHGIFSRMVYTGSDLQTAKKVYYETTGPARTMVELYTQGNHTASRKCH